MARRILVADDHDLVREGVRVLLEAHPGWRVCGEAANGMEAVQKARELRPDLVILDLTMPEMNGLEAARHILQDSPKTPILVFTIDSSHQFDDVARAIGVRGCLTKGEGGVKLIKAVRALLKNKTYFGPHEPDNSN